MSRERSLGWLKVRRLGASYLSLEFTPLPPTIKITPLLRLCPRPWGFLTQCFSGPCPTPPEQYLDLMPPRLELFSDCSSNLLVSRGVPPTSTFCLLFRQRTYNYPRTRVEWQSKHVS